MPAIINLPLSSKNTLEINSQCSNEFGSTTLQFCRLPGNRFEMLSWVKCSHASSPQMQSVSFVGSISHYIEENIPLFDVFIKENKLSFINIYTDAKI